MATTDIKILEGRLLTRDSAITGSTVTKCALKMQQLFATLQNPDNKGEDASDITSAALESFSRDLLLYKLEMGKFGQSFNMLDEEAVEYDSLEASIESNIEETTQSIVALTQELVQQKKLKQHREECEALSRIVNLVPSTRKILASSNLVNEEICRLEEQLASTESIEKLRNRQVNLLLQSIADLSQSLEEEETLQKQLQQLHQSVENQTHDDEDANEENDEDLDGEDESRDKRSERGKGKRKKPSGDGDDLEEETTEGGENTEGSEVTKKQKSSGGEEVEVEEGEAVEQSAPSTMTNNSAARIGGSGSPVVMTVKEKLLQQQVKRAQKKLEKELLREKEKEKEEGEQRTQVVMSTSTSTTISSNTDSTETEEGEEEEGVMDTSA